MADWPLLSLVTFLPLVGVVLILLLRGDDEVAARNSRAIALWTSLLTFLLMIGCWRRGTRVRDAGLAKAGEGARARQDDRAGQETVRAGRARSL